MRWAAVLIAGWLCTPAWCGTQTVRVIGVTDGDTIKVLDADRHELRIRLASIDSPERKQAYGEKAKKSLSDLVFGTEVDIDCRKKLSYDRLVCVVYLGGNDMNLAQIQRGMAWWSRNHAHEQTPSQREQYEAAEGEAQTERVGLWAEQNPVPPWEWRHRRQQ